MRKGRINDKSASNFDRSTPLLQEMKMIKKAWKEWAVCSSIQNANPFSQSLYSDPMVVDLLYIIDVRIVMIRGKRIIIVSAVNWARNYAGVAAI